MYKLSGSLFFLIPLLSFSREQIKYKKTDTLFISGEISNFKKSPEYIYAYFLDGNKTGLDSVQVKEGKYSIERIIQAPTLVTLSAGNPDIPGNLKYVLPIVTEPAHIKIISSDTLTDAKVTGSKANIEYSHLQLICEPNSQLLRELFSTESKQKEVNSETDRKIDSVNNALSLIYYKYLQQHPESLIKPFVLEKYLFFLPEIPNQQEIINANTQYYKLSVNERNSFIGEKVKKQLDSYSIKIGMMAPDFNQSDTSGTAVSLNDFRGKYILLDFWASWCGPCRKENPNLVKLYNTYHLRNFTILSVSLDDSSTRKAWFTAIEKDGLKWRQLSDLKGWQNSVVQEYKVAQVPADFLIDPSGKIIGVDVFGSDLENRLKGIFQ